MVGYPFKNPAYATVVCPVFTVNSLRSIYASSVSVKCTPSILSSPLILV